MQAGRGSPQAENAEIGRAIERYMRDLFGDPRQLREKIESLTGGRGGDPAVRAKVLQAMFASMPADPLSREATTLAPTKAEHDALVADVHSIFAAVNAMRSLL